MGQRYEKNRNSVFENRETRRRIGEEGRILSEEFVSLQELSGMIDSLDDDIADSVRELETVQVTESERLVSEQEQADVEKEKITTDINVEIDKLDVGVSKLDQLRSFEFGQKAVDSAEKTYRAEISQFKELLDELDASDYEGTNIGTTASYEASGSLEKIEVDAENSDFIREESIGGFASKVISSDVRKWNDGLPELSNKLQQYYLNKYGNIISNQKLSQPLSDSVVYEPQGMFTLQGIERGVLGYNDGSKSHIAVGSGYELQTTIHENLHQLSANGDRRGIIQYSGQGRVNVQMNEAITEMLTQRTMGYEYGPDYSAYSNNRDAMKLIESVVGEDNVSRAYFQNKPELLSEPFERVMGTGSWQQLSEAFDDSLSNIAHTAEAGRIRRDDLINRFMIASSNKSDWRALL